MKAASDYVGQLWIEAGDRPTRKYVITSKTVAQAPQYTVQVARREDVQEAAAHQALKPVKSAPPE